MIDFATYDDLKRLSPSPSESRSLLRSAHSKAYKNTFLSHSSKDEELLPAVILILEQHGGKVYVDKGDDRLPEKPSTETAQVLRSTIRELRRFVLLVSTNSKSSRWIPWELGLADGAKYPDSVSLFPVSEHGYRQDWSEQEYLGLYQRVLWGNMKGYERPLWIVYNHHTNSGQPLREWLREY